jgi:isopentenyl-diphosphate delta-isomerase
MNIIDQDLIILVDENDREIGTAEKLSAHRGFILHRAISVFLFNAKSEILIQRRAATKYHASGLWANACCSHPRPGETTIQAAERRLSEELGCKSEVKFVQKFVYAAEVHPLFECEFVHLFIGQCNAPLELNPDEVSEVSWMGIEPLFAKMDQEPEKFAPWFRMYRGLFGTSGFQNFVADLKSDAPAPV